MSDSTFTPSRFVTHRSHTSRRSTGFVTSLRSMFRLIFLPTIISVSSEMDVFAVSTVPT